MADTTLTALRRLVKTRFKGVLKAGKHKEDGEACALECLSVLRGVPWTDDPGAVRSFDLRPLNDLPVSDEVRTKHLLPIIAAYDGSLDWPKDRQQAVATALAIGTVNVLIAELAGLPAEIAKACREATSLKGAESAAWAAWAARAAAWAAAESAESAALAARAAAWAAESAAWAAESAAWAARAAARAAESAEWAARAASRAARAAESAALERVFIAACKVWMDAAKAK